MRMQREQPGPGQESVWDYPRPPRVDASGEHVVVRLDGGLVAETSAPLRVLETSHPPTYYLPRTAFVDGALSPAEGASFCEFKGRAAYLDVSVGDRVAARAGWCYPTPTPGFAVLAGHVALYPGPFTIEVAGERVRAQEGDFYGGWITSRVVGPFKGAPSTRFW